MVSLPTLCVGKGDTPDTEEEVEGEGVPVLDKRPDTEGRCVDVKDRSGEREAEEEGVEDRVPSLLPPSPYPPLPEGLGVVVEEEVPLANPV